MGVASVLAVLGVVVLGAIIALAGPGGVMPKPKRPDDDDHRTDPNEVIEADSIVGSCAFCPCGERVELDVAVVRSTRVEHQRCPSCIRLIRVPARSERS